MIPTSLNRFASTPVTGRILEMSDSELSYWCDSKLSHYVDSPDGCMVEIKDPGALTAGEHQRISGLVQANNFFFYQFDQDTYGVEGFQLLAGQLGLTDVVSNPGSSASGVSIIEPVCAEDSETTRAGYIPYTNKPLNWHTDGYYNEETDKVRSFILHCESTSESGGQNQLVDHELLFAWLRMEHPDLVSPLLADNCLTIPGHNRPEIRYSRSTTSHPVFDTDTLTGSLYMRYTQRKVNAAWQNSPGIRSALDCLANALGSSRLPIISALLLPGQGMVCNNVLHNRAAFKNGEWNHYRIVAKGPRIQTWINDQMIEDLTDEPIYETHAKGFIGLQVHGIKKGTGPYDVAWRKIRIKELH